MGVSRKLAALLTITSTRPRSPTTYSTTSRGASGRARSAGTASARPPAPRMADATFSRRSERLPTSATSRPRWARMRAVDSPMPEPPPVTIATRSSNLYDDTTTRARCDHRCRAHGSPDWLRVRAWRPRGAFVRARSPPRAGACERGLRAASGALDTRPRRGAAGRGARFDRRGSRGRRRDAADVLVESLPEDLELKVAVLREALAAAPNAIVATNTSSIPITVVGGAIGAPERTVGDALSNPPLLDAQPSR